MPTIKKADAAQRINAASKLAPAAPERSGASVAKKRRRLAKVFSRPLDKKFKHPESVREKFSMLPQDYAQLLLLKQRLAEQGVSVKKGELLRAGLLLLAAVDDGDLPAALAKPLAIG